jgi:hypothetical protein
MDEPGASPRVVVAGDLADPLVADLAAALPADAVRVDCPGDLPDSWPDAARDARSLVLHRSFLTAGDAERLARDRRAGRFPKVVLCVGPHARYHHVQRWSERVDVVLPEAIAPEVVGRYVAADGGAVPPAPAGRTVAVVSGLYEVGSVLADALAASGYAVSRARDWSSGPAGELAVWDVPVLEPDWPAALERAAATRPVVALIGFADRALVRLARSRGASAVLDLPCDPADLAYVLHRLGTGLAGEGRPRAHRAHARGAGAGPHRPAGVGGARPDAYNAGDAGGGGEA